MRFLRCLGIPLAVASCLVLAAKCPYRPIPADGTVIELAGLAANVRVVTDELGVPHIYAESDTDLTRVQGWIHARDRFFQMDVSRRQASGTYAELVGGSALLDDLGIRLMGLRLAAARSESLLTPSTRAILEAYAEGVNAYLAVHPLPPEYGDLEITSAPEWSVVDSLVIGKAFDAQGQYADWLVTDFFEIYAAACQAATPPCDGWVLLDEEIARWDPMDPTNTIPDATGSFPFDPEPPPAAALKRALPSSAGIAACRIAAGSGGRSRLGGSAAVFGSNAWGVAAEHSATGHPMVAADNHLPLQTPSTLYENHLVVTGDPPMNLSGTTFPGVPLVLNGLNGQVAWGSTVFYSDRSDAFSDRLVRDAPGCPARLCIESEGALHPVEERSETYRYNNPSSGIPDDLVDATFSARLFCARVRGRSDGSLPQLRSRGRCRGPERDRRPCALFPGDGGRHPAVRGPARHGRDRRPRPVGACAGRLRVPGGGEAIRRGLAELGGGRRRREPRVLHERRDPAAGRPRGGERGRPERSDPGRIGAEQLDRGPRALAGADHPLPGPSLRRDAADREPGERVRGDREQRSGGSPARQRSAQPVPAGPQLDLLRQRPGTAHLPFGPAGSRVCSARRSTRGRRSRRAT